MHQFLCNAASAPPNSTCWALAGEAWAWGQEGEGGGNSDLFSTPLRGPGLPARIWQPGCGSQGSCLSFSSSSSDLFFHHLLFTKLLGLCLHSAAEATIHTKGRILRRARTGQVAEQWSWGIMGVAFRGVGVATAVKGRDHERWAGIWVGMGRGSRAWVGQQSGKGRGTRGRRGGGGLGGAWGPLGAPPPRARAKVCAAAPPGQS